MKSLRLSSILAIAALVVGVLGTTASAQNFAYTLNGASSATTAGIPDTLKVNYFSNANTASAPDGTVEITNPGSPAGNLCASIFVWDPQQELTECCSCLVTPNGLRTLSVDKDLTANPLTGVTLTRGEVAIVSTIVPRNGVCNPLENIVAPTIRAWGTHIQNGNFAVTETEYSDRVLGPWNDLQLYECFAIELDGSGHGVCSCGSGD